MPDETMSDEMRPATGATARPDEAGAAGRDASGADPEVTREVDRDWIAALRSGELLDNANVDVVEPGPDDESGHDIEATIDASGELLAAVRAATAAVAAPSLPPPSPALPAPSETRSEAGTGSSTTETAPAVLPPPEAPAAAATSVPPEAPPAPAELSGGRWTPTHRLTARSSVATLSPGVEPEPRPARSTGLGAIVAAVVVTAAVLVGAWALFIRDGDSPPPLDPDSTETPVDDQPTQDDDGDGDGDGDRDGDRDPDADPGPEGAGNESDNGVRGGEDGPG